MESGSSSSAEEVEQSGFQYLARKRQKAPGTGGGDGASERGRGKLVDTVTAESLKCGRCCFNDPTTADVIVKFSRRDDLNQSSETAPEAAEVDKASRHFFLHSEVLVQSGYFRAVLSQPWQEQQQQGDAASEAQENSLGGDGGDNHFRIKISVSSVQELHSYAVTLRLLYTGDFSRVISSVERSVAILPVATHLLFNDCITACVEFLEAVPWTESEEEKILHVVSHLRSEEAAVLLARLGPVQENASEEMLCGLVYTATHSPQNISASVKTFVARMLGDHSSRETVRVVLEKAFAGSLKTVKDSVEEYSNPNVRGGRYDEIEAMQRQNLHTAVVKGKSLLWIVERMIELRVAKTAVTEWSKQDTFTANLKRAFGDDTWRNIAPGLPALVLRCTCRLAHAVAAGSIIAPSQVRLKLVNDWLPVLLVSRENKISATQNKQLHLELEEVFLQIILTLPIVDAQKLLQQCLSFATRTVEDCPHLAIAFSTWFRRANSKRSLTP